MTRLFLPLLFLLMAGLPSAQQTPGGAQQPSEMQRHQLQKEIAERQKELDRVRQDRDRLEETISNRERLINQIENQRETYEYNLNQSREESAELERRIEEVNGRISTHRSLILGCIQAARPQPGDASMFHRRRSRISAELAKDRLERISSERVEAEALRSLLERALAYQDRILHRYMPNEADQKERMASYLEHDSARLELRSEEVVRIVAELHKLESRAKALDAALKRIHSQAAEARSQSQAGRQLQRSAFRPGVLFESLKGRLPPPALGRVIRAFGPYTHPSGGVTIQSYGLDIEISAEKRVNAVADGRVMFTGFVPEYGDIVALEHGGGYLTVYGNVTGGGLSEGQVVTAGAPLGTVEETNGKLILHFEIRKENQAIDPQPWLGS